MTDSSSPTNLLPLPSWLPALLLYNGDWDTFLRALYSVFSADFKSGTLRYQGYPVWYDRRIEAADSHGYEEGFWHLVTRDDFVWNPSLRRKEKQRLPDIERARQLPWGRPTIENENAPEVVVWNFDEETKKGKVDRTYLWLKQWDYVVVLERQEKSWGAIFMLITAFPVDIPAKRIDLESRYNRRKK
jgi:hypothetical protein